jgi:DtxR family manganese transport transcriptional regulator
MFIKELQSLLVKPPPVVVLQASCVTKSRNSSDPHQRTRRDHATETAEDYVEAVADFLELQEVCRVTDLARRFGVSHVTVNRIVERLQKEGLLATEPYQPIELTPKGRRLAARCRERHEVVYRFLLSIGVDEPTAAIDAEGIEHHVSPMTLKRFKMLIQEGQVRS